MPKIDIESLSKADKKRLRVWDKEKVVIEIGSAFYEVEPQPARAVLQFQELFTLYTDYATQYKDIKAEDIKVGDLKGLVETIVESPCHLLRPFVPDLEQEDADAAPWGQTFHNFGVLAEINGLGWGEKLLKEYVLPFVPELLKSLLVLGEGTMKARARAGLIGESGSETLISSSTPSPESLTDSTLPEP